MNARGPEMLGDMWWILIAEDEPEVREMFRNAIIKKVDSMGMLAHIVEVPNGAEAIVKAGGRTFDCIVTDLRMPIGTGEDFIRTIQSQPLNFNTPVIVISAHAREEFQNFCSEFQHIRYLDKPCTPDEVSETVMKELNYGKRDGRVSVHLLSPFIKAVKKNFGPKDSETVTVQKPIIKKSGKEMPGQVHCILSLRSEFSKAHFCISFDESFFRKEPLSLEPHEEIGIAITKESPVRLTGWSRDLTFELIEQAMEHLKICLGGTPRLKGLTQVLNSRIDDSHRALLVNATAVTVGIMTPKGHIYLSALSAKDFNSLVVSNAA
jgi:CheY-like chemotaxis protein